MTRRRDPDARQRQNPDRRPHLHRVRLTDDQERAVQERARAAGVTVSKMLADLGTDGATAPSRRATNIALTDLALAVHDIGHNVNQLARVANTTRRADDAHLVVVQRIATAFEALEADIRARISDL